MSNFSILLPMLTLLFTSINAHFLMNYPPSLGFDQNKEDQSPCGGATISFSSTTSFHVGGDAIAVTTLHPQSDLLFQATLDQTASGNWSVMALIAEYGLGAFCEPALSVPAGWAGKNGLLQIVQNAEDGIHYQCVAVNFVAGISSSMPSACQNASGNSAAFVSDTTLLPASGTVTPTATSTANVSGSSASKTASAPATATTKASGAEERLGRARWWAGIAGALLMAVMLL